MKTKALQTFDIVISGGGPAGLTLALLLGQAGLDVALIDPDKLDRGEKPSGRTAALLNNSLNVLKQAGIWDHIESFCTPLKIMKIVDAHDEKSGVTFHAADIGEDQFGFNVPNNLLKSRTMELLDGLDNITLINPDRLSSYTVQGQTVSIETENGRNLNARLIIGTDGRSSRVRTIAGIDVKKHDYGQTAITCLITHTKPHNFQSTETHRSGGPFTLVPMAGNMSSVVWVEKTDDANAFLAMKKQDFEQALQDRTNGMVGTITLANTPDSWPLMTMTAQRLVGPRAAIAAEAAHVLSPIGAQGLNLSLRDISSLAETLIDAARLGEDIGSEGVLSRYERRRHLDIGSRIHGIDAFNRLVANDVSFLQDLRKLGLKGLERVIPLKHLAMAEGLNPRLDGNRLLKGRAL